MVTTMKGSEAIHNEAPCDRRSRNHIRTRGRIQEESMR